MSENSSAPTNKPNGFPNWFLNEFSAARGRIGFLWVVLVVLLAPVLAMLLWSLVVIVLLGWYSLTDSPLPAQIDQLLTMGPLGDTFGGLLAPLLNALVLGATIAIALRQGKQAQQALEKTDNHFREEQSKAEGRFREQQAETAKQEQSSRADKVGAWVAETERGADGSSHLGVVVINASNALVRDFDVLMDVDHLSSPRKLRNRESVVPPGTWFLQIGHENESWPVPVPVANDGQLKVELPSSDKDARQKLFPLHVHPPEKVDGQELPYYYLTALRFDVHGKSWWRDRDGALSETMPQGVDESEQYWEAAFEPLASTPRTPTVGPERRRPSNARLQEQVRTFANHLASPQDVPLERNRRYPVGPALEGAGVAELRLSRNEHSLFLYANAEDEDKGHVLWFAGKIETGVVPNTIEVLPPHGSCELHSFREDLQAINDPVRQAAAFAQRLQENKRQKGTICGCDPSRVGNAVSGNRQALEDASTGTAEVPR